MRISHEMLASANSDTKKTRGECEEIWNEVYTQIRTLVDNGDVDASIGERLTERDRQFRNGCDAYDAAINDVDRRTTNVSQIGASGSEAIQRTLGRGL